ncbi:hypothetical protein [Pedobacter sp. SL55]|nr:hypothetical protein [Pedobacter sp. SL55]WAC42180.1 hypothetical protein OVA16_07450 [Pedobacter sp. SL55]
MLTKIKLQLAIEAIAVIFLLSFPLLFLYGQNQQQVLNVQMLGNYAFFA